jgi:large subunit ribosomal protein L25
MIAINAMTPMRISFFETGFFALVGCALGAAGAAVGACGALCVGATAGAGAGAGASGAAGAGLGLIFEFGSIKNSFTVAFIISNLLIVLGLICLPCGGKWGNIISIKVNLGKENMSESSLNLTKRELTGKKAKSLRAQGIVPSVVFGGKEPILTQSEYVETDKAVRAAGYHSPIDLVIDGKKQMAMVKNVAIDPVKHAFINIEFQAIKANAVVEATAPIAIVNYETSDASKAHLEILHVLEEIEVKAKPADLPEAIEVDASKLAAAGDRLTIADIKLPKGVEFADKEIDTEAVIANVYDPAEEAAERDAKAEADKTAEETRAAEEAAAAEEEKKEA